MKKWSDSLHGKEPSINEKQLAFAQIVWEEFGCTTLGDYHDLYLKTDVAFLEDMFEVFEECARLIRGGVSSVFAK